MLHRSFRVLSARGSAATSGSRLISICTVDAFASKAFEGNPAAVCVLDRPGTSGACAICTHECAGADSSKVRKLSDKWKQSVALEMNLSETAFLEPLGPSHYTLRWFTPTDEVDLCGHATLASAHALWQNGIAPAGETISFDTRWSGALYATPTDDGWIELDFPSETGREEVPVGHADHTHIAESLGLAPEQLKFVGRNRCASTTAPVLHYYSFSCSIAHFLLAMVVQDGCVG